LGSFSSCRRWPDLLGMRQSVGAKCGELSAIARSTLPFSVSV
jgi:hypothetical protein